MSKMFKNAGFYLLLALVLALVLAVFKMTPTTQRITYSDFVKSFKAGEIKGIEYYPEDNKIIASAKNKNGTLKVDVIIPSIETLNEDLGTDITNEIMQAL